MATLKNPSKDELNLLAKSVIGVIEKDKDLSMRLSKAVTTALVSDPKLGSFLIDALTDQFPQSVLSKIIIKFKSVAVPF